MTYNELVFSPYVSTQMLIIALRLTLKIATDCQICTKTT